MAKIELAVRLDRDTGVYEPGETIAGHVDVRATEACESRRLSVGLGVVARPRGPVEHASERVGVVDKALLAENLAWQAGVTRTFPFRLHQKGLVRSYAGNLLSLELFVQATTAIHSSEARPIEITSRRDAGLHVAWTHGDLAVQRLRWVPAVALLAAAAAAATVWCAVTEYAPWVFVLSLLVTLVGVLAVATGVRPWLSQLRTGRVHLALERVPVETGKGREGDSALRVTLRVRPTTPLGGPPKATLVVREWARRVTSGASPTWTHELFRSAAELRPTGEVGQFAGEVRLPDAGTVPYGVSFGNDAGGAVGGSGFAIQWDLTAEIPVAGGIDWRRTVEIRARPIDVAFE